MQLKELKKLIFYKKLKIITGNGAAELGIMTRNTS